MIEFALAMLMLIPVFAVLVIFVALALMIIHTMQD
jgi:hypothetical protein